MGPQGAPSPAERGREGVKQGAGAGRGGSGGWERRESESGGGGGGDRSERTSCARRRMRRGWGGRCGGRGVVRGGKARWGEARGGERRGLRPTLGNPSVRAPPPPLPGFAAFLPVPTPSLESRATERPPPPVWSWAGVSTSWGGHGPGERGIPVRARAVPQTFISRLSGFLLGQLARAALPLFTESHNVHSLIQF